MTQRTKVLVVDDAKFILMVTETLLQAEGFEVRTADGGIEGIKSWVEWQPDLVLLDLMMPDKNGWEVIAEARTTPECAKTPVIIYSAKDDPLMRTKAKEAGAYEFILKPFDNKVLARIIREAVAEPA